MFGVRFLRWRKTLRRLGRRCLVHSRRYFFSHLACGLLKFFNPLAQALGQFRQFFGAKQDQNDGQNQDNFPTTEKCSKHDIHNSQLCCSQPKPRQNNSKAPFSFLLVPVEVQMNHGPIDYQCCSGNFRPFETMIFSTPDYAVDMFGARL